MIKARYSVVVIGAGAAGMTAATAAAQRNADVVLLDEQSSPGGQVYRSIEQQDRAGLDRLGEDYRRGRSLAAALRASTVQYLPETRVWGLDSRRQVGITHRGTATMVQADQVVISSGAIERPVPFPGWTLPGVMNAGAAQILCKSSNMVPGEDTVLAGSGPLLLLLACQYIRAGIRIQALLDLTPTSNRVRALPHLPAALLAFPYLRKGLAMEWAIKKAGIPVLRNVTDLQAEGEQRIEAVHFTHGNERKSLATAHLLVHFGVIPVNHLAQAAGCNHEWHEGQQCWRSITDQWGQSSVAGILIAGDSASIAGARSAELSGELASLQALCNLGIVTEDTRDKLARPLLQKRARDQRIRPFLETLFRIPDDLLQVNNDATLVCRCEEVTAGAIRKAVAAGHLETNQVKFFTRCGMGPCQGRQCAAAVSHIITASNAATPAQAGFYRTRPPVSTLSLGELASLYPGEAE